MPKKNTQKTEVTIEKAIEAIYGFSRAELELLKAAVDKQLSKLRDQVKRVASRPDSDKDHDRRLRQFRS